MSNWKVGDYFVSLSQGSDIRKVGTVHKIHRILGDGSLIYYSDDHKTLACFPKDITERIFNNPLNRKLYPNRIPVVEKNGKLIRVDPNREKWGEYLVTPEVAAKLNEENLD